MPDTNSQNNNTDQNNTNTNSQNGTTPQSGTNPNIGGSGKKYVIGIDHGGDGKDQQSMETVAQGIESCGNTVEITQVGPNQETYLAGHGADIAVYLCNGVDAWTMWSFVNKIKSGGLPFTIFAMEGWYHNESEPDGSLADMEHVRAEPFQPPHDGDQGDASAMHADSNAKNVGEYVDENSQYIALCYAKTPEEMAQNICSGSCGGGGATGGGSSGGGAQIKDKTFEKCMRRICAATDSIFLVENNAAVLFPYTDWMAFTLREKINTIKKNEIDPNVFSLEYGNDGFYNKVSIAWGGGTLPTRFPDSVKDKKDIVEDKRKHINYTIDDIIDNMSQNNFKVTNINQKIAKNKKQEAKTSSKNKKENTTQEISVDENGVTILSEQYDKFVDIYGEQEKRVQSSAPDLETAQYIVNALLIQYIRDYNHTCKCRALNNRKYIGGTFYAVQNPFDDSVEMFYLNSYTMRTQKNEPMYYDLEFKYGPEGAEEILDYQTLSGGAAASGGTTTGGSANEEQVWTTAAQIKYASANSTQDPEQAWKMFGGKESSSSTDCYGMSAYLYYCFNNRAGIPCQVVGNSGHHVVMIDRGNGFEETRNEYRKYNFDYSFKWRGNQDTTVLLPAPGTSGSTSGGNTNPNNTNSGNRG